MFYHTHTHVYIYTYKCHQYKDFITLKIQLTEIKTENLDPFNTCILSPFIYMYIQIIHVFNNVYEFKTVK